MGKRDSSIDLLKGIGMCTVVLYHTGMTGVIINYLTSFHMMLFFFASGYCLKKREHIQIHKLIGKKGRALIVPYIFATLIYTLLNYMLDRKHDIVHPASAYFRNIFFSSMSFGAVWYLLALFIAVVIGNVVVHFVKRLLYLF